jgi:hypothetical protein
MSGARTFVLQSKAAKITRRVGSALTKRSHPPDLGAPRFSSRLDKPWIAEPSSLRYGSNPLAVGVDRIDEDVTLFLHNYRGNHEKRRTSRTHPSCTELNTHLTCGFGVASNTETPGSLYLCFGPNIIRDRYRDQVSVERQATRVQMHNRLQARKCTSLRGVDERDARFVPTTADRLRARPRKIVCLKSRVSTR